MSKNVVRRRVALVALGLVVGLGAVAARLYALPSHGWVESYYDFAGGPKVGQRKLTCNGGIVMWGRTARISHYAEFECPIDTP